MAERQYDSYRLWYLLTLILCIPLIGLVSHVRAASTFNQVFTVSPGSGNVSVEERGQAVQLLLTQQSASGFQSINKYLFGSISMRIKLVGGNSAGTVTAYYLSSSTEAHDELDFEFLGNSSGEPYIVQTNVFANGVGGREMRHYLWFDPTKDFHTYSFLWNEQQIVFWVDGTPIRVFANNEAKGMAYPNKQAMKVYASLWNGDSWATQGGRVKIDWESAPFATSFDRFQISGCIWPESLKDSLPDCATSSTTSTGGSTRTPNWWEKAPYLTLSAQQLSRLQWVQHHYLVYHYCTDAARYPNPPFECLHPPS
eukprot:c14848_g1_i1 orf=4-936(-)